MGFEGSFFIMRGLYSLFHFPQIDSNNAMYSFCLKFAKKCSLPNFSKKQLVPGWKWESKSLEIDKFTPQE